MALETETKTMSRCKDQEQQNVIKIRVEREDEGENRMRVRVRVRNGRGGRREASKNFFWGRISFIYTWSVPEMLVKSRAVIPGLLMLLKSRL